MLTGGRVESLSRAYGGSQQSLPFTEFKAAISTKLVELLPSAPQKDV